MGSGGCKSDGGDKKTFCPRSSNQSCKINLLELVSDQVDLVHHSVGGGDVLLLLSHWTLHLLHGGDGLLGRQDHIAGAEV